MIKLIFMIILFHVFKFTANFSPEIEYVTTIKQGLSLPYYVTFAPETNKLGQYLFWVSNNPFGSKLANEGYVSKFNYNTENFTFNLLGKKYTPNVLGIAASPTANCVYPGIKSYPAITKNGQYLLQATNCPQRIITNSRISNCCKKNDLNYFSANTGSVKNFKLSPFTFKSKGIEYQLLATAFYNIVPIENSLTPIHISHVVIFTYALNDCIINQELSPIIVNSNNVNIPIDLEFSSFACVDGTYLLSITNANSTSITLFKIDISNPAQITANFYKAINVVPNIGNYQQYYSALSTSRYLALNAINVGANNLYAYYFDQNFNDIVLNNGSAYQAGSLSQVITWSPDAKALVVPNYLDNSLTIFKANVCNLTVDLSPTYTVQYPGKSSTLTAKVLNGTPPYTFYFSNGQVITQESDICHITVSPQITTVYNVTVIDSNNCITGIANTATVQIARPVIISVVPNCEKNNLCITGKILDPNGFPVIYTTIELFVNRSDFQKTYVTSDKSGVFKLEYKIT